MSTEFWINLPIAVLGLVLAVLSLLHVDVRGRFERWTVRRQLQKKGTYVRRLHKRIDRVQRLRLYPAAAVGYFADRLARLIIYGGLAALAMWVGVMGQRQHELVIAAILFVIAQAMGIAAIVLLTEIGTYGDYLLNMDVWLARWQAEVDRVGADLDAQEKRLIDAHKP